MVFESNGEVVTDSLTIAEMFGKRHDNVLSDIKLQMEYAGENSHSLIFRSHITQMNVVENIQNTI